MGGGGSKNLAAEGETVPEKLLPFLRTRYEQLKKRRGLRLTESRPTTLSKKELLEKDHASDDENERRSQRSDATVDESLNVAPVVDDRSSVCEEKEDEKPSIPPPCSDSEEEEEETERLVDNPNRRLLPPGSPSFRVYLPSVSSVGDDDEDAKDDNLERAIVKEDEGESSIEIEEGNVSGTPKKRRRGMRLRKVIPMGKPNGMKHLLYVKSCYASCSGCHSAPPIEQKTTSK